MQKVKSFFLTGKFLFDKKLATFLWFGLSIITVIQNLLDVEHRINIYKIFSYSYTHIHNFQNLYLEYPTQHDDVFLYGPTFTAFIAPFALLPDWLGVIFWVLFNVSILFFAIRQLPIKQAYQNAILILASHEMMNASSWLQYNAVIAACIILGFTFIQKRKEHWALLFIVFATITKIYGVVAFSFFFFSKDKAKFILWTVLWSVVLFIAPVLVTSYSFLVQSYQDWFTALVYKSHKNTMGITNNYYFQDISVTGLIRRNLNADFKGDVFILITAAVLFLGKLIRYKYFEDLRYQLYFLCSVLIFVVIFSTGAESPTYIIAFPACCLWFILQTPSKMVNAFFVFCLIVTSFSYSDLLTKYSREFSMRHSLKALPCLILWLVIVYQTITKQFLKIDVNNGLKPRLREK